MDPLRDLGGSLKKEFGIIEGLCIFSPDIPQRYTTPSWWTCAERFGAAMPAYTFGFGIFGKGSAMCLDVW